MSTVHGQICLDCPAWAWEENQPGGVYGPETHPRAFGEGEAHAWRPADIVERRVDLFPGHEGHNLELRFDADRARCVTCDVVLP